MTRARGHDLQLYSDEAALALRVAEFGSQGLQQGEGFVIIAGAARHDAFLRALVARRVDTATLAAAGRLVLLDADETLEQFMSGQAPERQRFSTAVRPVLRSARQSGAVRGYGEMVDLLWHRGQRDAAVQLERLWNELIAEDEFPLLCAYGVDPFEPTDRAWEDVCDAHTGLQLEHDESRFSLAVGHSLADTLGASTGAIMLGIAAGSETPGCTMAEAQRVLLWLNANMPTTARRVISRAREYYASR